MPQFLLFTKKVRLFSGDEIGRTSNAEGKRSAGWTPPPSEKTSIKEKYRRAKVPLSPKILPNRSALSMLLFRHYDDNEVDEYIYDGNDEMMMIDSTNNGTSAVRPLIRYPNISVGDGVLDDQFSPSATSAMTAQEIGTPNCTYRHDIGDDLIRSLSLWLDGPITIIAAILAFVGCYFAVCFLARAGLNRELTAALYTLCVCDAFLISTVVVYQSIEATSILFVDSNVMWDKQRSVLITHGIVSSATTASTLLVVFITFQRFLVVRWPLRFARMCASKRPTNSLHDAFLRKSSSSGCVEETELSGMFRSGGGLVRTLSKRLLRGSSNSNNRKPPDVYKLLRPFTFPVCVVVFAFLLNFSVFFEFELIPCFAFIQNAFSQQLFPTPLRRSQTYYMIRTAIAMGSQTIGPILIITLLTIITEYKVHRSLKARRVLFESQSRRRSIVALEELREKVSRTVAIFIAVKFLIFRSLPFFFDIYESFYGIESFGIVLSILVRLSDFGVMLNSATNSLAYFGKTEFFANRLRGKLLREKQHIMVAKVAASACLVACPSPAIERSSSKSSRGTMHSMPFSDIARRRQRKTIVYGMTSVSSNDCSSTVDTPLIRISFLSLRNGTKSSGWTRAVVEDGGTSIRHNGHGPLVNHTADGNNNNRNNNNYGEGADGSQSTKVLEQYQKQQLRKHTIANPESARNELSKPFRGMDRGKQTNGASKEHSERGEEHGTKVSGTEAEYAQYKSIGQQNNTTNTTTTAQFESLLAVQRCQQAAPTTTCTGDVIINGN